VLGVDTNVLIRFLTDDDAKQSPLALRLVTATANQPIHICLVALVETVWVLTKVKRRPVGNVIAACRELLDNGKFRIESATLVRQALVDAERVGCDLADALIALANLRAGCEATATFDADALGLDSMVPVEDRL
jgi:predicted nucleic-acid-binding protein